MCVWKGIYSPSRANVHVRVQPHVCLYGHMKVYLFLLPCSQPCMCSTTCVFVCACENVSIPSLAHISMCVFNPVCVQPCVCACENVSVPSLTLTSVCVFNPMCVCVCMWKCIWLSLSQLTPCIAPAYSLCLRCSDSCMQAGPMFPHLPSQQLSLFWINEYWESPSEFYYRILEHNKNSDGKKNNFPWEGGSRIGGK